MNLSQKVLSIIFNYFKFLIKILQIIFISFNKNAIFCMLLENFFMNMFIANSTNYRGGFTVFEYSNLYFLLFIS